MAPLPGPPGPAGDAAELQIHPFYFFFVRIFFIIILHFLMACILFCFSSPSQESFVLPVARVVYLLL